MIDKASKKEHRGKQGTGSDLKAQEERVWSLGQQGGQEGHDGIWQRSPFL